MFIKNYSQIQGLKNNSKNVYINESKDFNGFSYYEYKYLVEHKNFKMVKDLLDEFFGLSDPYPSGIVDSIYYDTRDKIFLGQCLNGEEFKCKFRIRGYGNGEYNQIHQKIKHLSGVSKFKAKLIPCKCPHENAPTWEELMPKEPFDNQFNKIMYNARQFGPLYPSVRIQYFRYRYRKNDYRITFDTNIEAFAPVNGLPSRLGYAVLDHHVLELKTTQIRPNLPFIGLVKLSQVSFSKFMLGLARLNE